MWLTGISFKAIELFYFIMPVLNFFCFSCSYFCLCCDGSWFVSVERLPAGTMCRNRSQLMMTSHLNWQATFGPLEGKLVFFPHLSYHFSTIRVEVGITCVNSNLCIFTFLQSYRRFAVPVHSSILANPTLHIPNY